MINVVRLRPASVTSTLVFFFCCFLFFSITVKNCFVNPVCVARTPLTLLQGQHSWFSECSEDVLI